MAMRKYQPVCGSCGAQVIWLAHDRTHTPAPIDADPVPDDIRYDAFMLVEQLPFTPSRFILQRGYPSREAAIADAWDVMTRHNATVVNLQAISERANAVSAEQQLATKQAKHAKQRKEAGK